MNEDPAKEVEEVVNDITVAIMPVMARFAGGYHGAAIFSEIQDVLTNYKAKWDQTNK